MKKFLNYLLSLVGFDHREMLQSVSLPVGRSLVIPISLSVVIPILEKPVLIPIRHCSDLTCVSVGKKKVRFTTRRGHQMVAEILDRNGDGKVLLRRPGHRFGPTFRRVLTE